MATAYENSSRDRTRGDVPTLSSAEISTAATSKPFASEPGSSSPVDLSQIPLTQSPQFNTRTVEKEPTDSSATQTSASPKLTPEQSAGESSEIRRGDSSRSPTPPQAMTPSVTAPEVAAPNSGARASSTLRSGQDTASAFMAFSQSTATEIARTIPFFGNQLSGKFSADRQQLSEQTPPVSVSIAAPQKLPESPRPNLELPTADTVKLESVKDSPSSLPEEELAVPDQPEGNAVNTSGGARPQYRQGKADDPNRMNGVAAESKALGIDAQAATASAIASDQSANRIQPVAVERGEQIALAESSNAVETSSSKEMNEYLQTEVPANVRAQADADFAPKLNASLAEPQGVVAEASQQRNQQIDQAFTEGQAMADQASLEAKSAQDAAIAEGRQQVEAEKQRFVEESESKLAEFDKDVTDLDSSTRSEIATTVKTKQQEANEALADGEEKAETAQKTAERDAAEAEKTKQASKKEKKKKNWLNPLEWVWEIITYIPRKAIEICEKAVTKAFNVAKDAIKSAIATAKNLAVSIINGVKDLVVGMIKTFAKGLKLLVGGLLIFFPELRKRANAAIDSAIDTAVGIVEDIAKQLEDKVVSLIDTVGGWVMKAVTIFETAVMTAIALTKALLTGNFMDAAMILFLAACKALGLPGEEFVEVLKDARSAFMDIIKSPAKFLKNLIKSVRQGFGKFSANFRERFISGLTGWLFGNLASAGIQLPKKINLKSIFMFLIQVIGFTAEYIKGKVIAIVGAENVARVEQVMTFVHRMFIEGPGAVWQWIKDKAAEVKQRIVEAATEWLITKIITEATIKLATMFTPVGAFVQAILIMYNTIMFFVERIKQIFQLVKSITSSFKEMAQGAVAAAADWIDQSLTRTIPLIIAFLARLLGLSGIGAKIQAVVKKLRAPIDKAITFVVRYLVKLAKKAWGGIKKGAGAIKRKIQGWLTSRVSFTNQDGKTHTLFYEQSAGTTTLMVHSEKDTVKTYTQAAAKATKDASKGKAAEQQQQNVAAAEKKASKEAMPQKGKAFVDAELNRLASCLAAMAEPEPKGPDKNALREHLAKTAAACGLTLEEFIQCCRNSDADAETVKMFFDIGADLTPGVGQTKAFDEVIAGKNRVTNEKVNRWLAAIGFIPAGKLLSRIPGVARVLEWARNLRKSKTPRVNRSQLVRWDEAHRKWLRRRTPSKAIKAKFGKGRFDPLYKDVLADSLEADHIVSFDTIVEIPGFKQLTPENQLHVLNNESNFIGMVGTINAAKGERTFEGFDRAGGHFLHGRPTNRRVLEKLIERERTLKEQLRHQIEKLLKEQK